MIIIAQIAFVVLCFTSTSFMHLYKFPVAKKIMTIIVIVVNFCAIILELILRDSLIYQESVLIISVLLLALMFGIAEIVCKKKYIKIIEDYIKTIIGSSPPNLTNSDIQKLLLKSYNEYASLKDVEKALQRILQK